jgi:hypothetical protein
VVAGRKSRFSNVFEQAEAAGDASEGRFSFPFARAAEKAENHTAARGEKMV